MSTGLAGWSSWATRPGVHALQLGVVAIAGTAALAYMLAPMRGPKKLSRKLSSKKSRKPSVLASPAAVTRELPVTAPIKESEVVADPPNPKVVSENQDVKVSSDKAPVQTPVVVDVSMKEVNSPVPEVTSKETSVCDQPDADKIASAVIPEEPSFSPSETTCLGTSKSNEAVSKVVSERQEDVEVLFSCDKHDIDNVYAFQALRHESPIPVGSELAFALPAVVPINVEAEVDVAVPVAVADAPAPTVDIVKQENAKVLFSCDKNDVAKVYAFQMLRYESPLPASSELAFILPAIVPVKEVEADAVAVADAPVSTVVSGKQEDVNHDVEVLEEPVQIPLDVDLPTESVKVDIPMAVPEVVSEETFASEQHDSDEIAVAVVPEEPPSSPSGSTCCGSSKSSDHSSSPVKAAFNLDAPVFIPVFDSGASLNPAAPEFVPTYYEFAPMPYLPPPHPYAYDMNEEMDVFNPTIIPFQPQPSPPRNNHSHVRKAKSQPNLPKTVIHAVPPPTLGDFINVSGKAAPTLSSRASVSDMSRPVFVEKAAAVDAGRRSPNVRRKDIQKCIFGVGCANAKSGKCQYYHANEVCKFYPNCKYGSGCIYVHPNPVVA